jgi:LemA protein
MISISIFIAVLILFIILAYNGLISKKNNVANAFAGIETVLKQRYDLIPNLIETVKQYSQHEKSILTEITELRTKALNNDDSLSDKEKLDLDDKISKLVSNLIVAVENYPDLKANQNFLQLQAALNEIEEKISASRRSYNASVLIYNNALEMFPSSIFANMMNYKKKDFFQTKEEERENINVKQMFKS